MPIITKNRVKTLLQLHNNQTYDELIDELIPIVQDFIVDYCNNSFKDTNIYINSTSISFADTDPDTILDALTGFVTAKFADDMEIVVEGSKHNNKMFTIDTVAAGTLTLVSTDSLITEAAENEVTITKVEWPKGIWGTTARLIGFDIARTKEFMKLGISAESYGDYSRSYAIMGETGGYPSNILGGLNPYRKVSFK